MVRRWDRWRNPWDREYAKRGRLWRGGAEAEPLPNHASPPGPVLEVGCGDGKFLAALTAAGYQWVGLDFSRNALRMIPPDLVGARVQANACRLPFQSAIFAIVTARYLLGALTADERRVCVEGLLRVLRPGGVLFVQEFSTKDLRFGRGTEVEPGTFERNQGLLTHYFEADELRNQFSALEVLEARPVVQSLRILGFAHRRESHLLVLRKAG